MKVTRKSARALQALVIFMAIAMVATAVPAVMFGSLPQAAAAEATVSNESQLQQKLSDSNTTKITLASDINVSAPSDLNNNFAWGISRHEAPIFSVPADKTVELNMNGHTIKWNFEKDNQYDLLATEAYPSGNYVSGTSQGGFHWIMLDNKGTLNITGSGSLITNFYTNNVTAQGQDHNWRMGAICTIRNSGNLTISDTVNINSKFGYVIQDYNKIGTSVYLTAIGIYQTGGTVTYGGSMSTEVWSQAGYSGQVGNRKSAAAVALGYGIYAASGDVNYLGATGKKISVFTYAGFEHANNEPENNMLQSNAVGIYTASNNSQIIGATIDCKVTYDDDDEGSSGGDGVFQNTTNITSAIGVAYSGNVTPTVGSGTNITTSCGVYNTNGWSGAYPPEHERPVCKISKAPLNLFAPSSDFKSWSSNVASDPTSTSTYKDETGNTWSPAQSDTALSGGIPNSQTNTYHKVLVAYRYFDSDHQLQEVYVKSSEISQKANTVSLNHVSNGRVTLSSYQNFVYTSGGLPKNSYFHKLNSISYSQVGSGNIRANWATVNNGGQLIATLDENGAISVVNGTVPVSAGNTSLVYVDYTAIPVDSLRVNINNASIMDEENNVAELEYTGSAPVFGRDIMFNVYKCMGHDDDPTATRPYSNDINVTNRFSVIGSGSGNVTYDVFDEDAVKVMTNALPSVPGTYRVKMNLAGETDYNASPSRAMNFAPLTYDFDLIIRPRNVTITQTGTPEITYGQTLDSLKTADLNNYFSIDTGVAGLAANGTFEWVTPNEMPEVGEHTYQLKWVNSQGYFETQVLDSVKVKVNKAPITVTAKNKTVTYGEELELTAEDFIFSGLADKTGEAARVFDEIKSSARVDGAAYIPAGFDAGVHQLSLSAASTSNYNITNVPGELHIDPARLTITAPAVTKEYDGLQTVDIPFDATCVISGLYDVYGPSGVMLETYAGAPLANGGSVGQTTAQIVPGRVALSGVKARNYTVGAVTNANSVVVNVVKASPLVDTLVIENTAITYDPTKTLSGFENLVPADLDRGYIKVVAAGDTLADGRPATPGKWVWKNNEKPTVAVSEYIAEFRPDDENYANVEQAITVEVARRDITVSVSMADVFYGDDQPSGTYTFAGFPSGSGERISVTGSTFNAVGFTLSGNLYYSCAYDPTKLDSRAAGDYPVTLTNTLTADNYRFITDTDCTLTVKPKDLVITPVQKSITYGTTLQQSDFSFTAAGLVAGDEALQSQLQASYAFDVSSSSDVGEYPLTVSFANTIPNYNIVINPGKIVVTKALVTVTADDIEVTYGGTPNYTYTYAGFKGTDANHVDDIVTGAPTFSSNYSTSSKAGETFSIIVGVNGLSATNYAFQASSRVSTLTVVTGRVNVTTWPTFTVENGKTLANAIIATDGAAVSASDGKAIAGTFRINNRDAVLEYKNNGKAGNNVEVTFYPTDTNYESVQGTAAVTVTPKEVSGQPTIQGALMEGETIALDVSTLNPSSMTYYNPATVVWSIGGDVVATGVQRFTLTSAHVGKVVSVSIEPFADSGYTGTASYTTSIRVSETLPIPTANELNIPEETITAVYDKQAHKFTVNKANQNIGDLTVRYNGSTTAPTAAGTYIVTVDIGTSNVGMFAPVSGLRVGTLVIEPRPITVTFTAADKTYDGKDNATISDFDASVGIIPGDNVTVNRSAATYTFTDVNAADGVEVVMNYAYLEGTAKDNYVISQDAVYANILPKEITAVASAADQNYSESDFTVHTISFGAPTGVLAMDRNAITLNNTTGSVGSNAAGSQDVTYIEYTGVLTGAKAGNYTFAASNESTLKVNILQVDDPTMEYPTAISASYSSLQHLEDLAGELPYGWTWDEPMTVPTVRVKTYSATYTPANTSYKTATFKVPVNVSPVEVTVTPETIYLTYGDAVPNLTYTVEGFTGDDGPEDCSGMIIIQTTYTQGANVTGEAPYRIWVNRSTIANPNYTFNLRNEGAIHVSKRDYIVTPSVNSIVYDPNNTSVTVNFTGEGAYVDPDKGEDDVALSYTSAVGSLANNNAGTRPVSYTAPTLVGSKAGNYDLKVAGAAIAVTIEKADPIVTFPITATVSYGQRFSTAAFDGGVGDGTFAFIDSSKVANEITSTYYDVRFTPTDSKNYNSLTQAVLLQVMTAEMNMSASISGTLYEGQTLTAAISGVPQDAVQYLRYSWYRVNADGAEVLVGEANTYELGAQDIGCYIKLVVSTDPTAPYTGDSEFTTVRPVEEEQLTFWQKLMKWWYSILSAIQSLFDHLGGR